MTFLRVELNLREPELVLQALEKPTEMNPKSMVSPTRSVPAIHLGTCQQTIWTDEFNVIDLPIDELARQLTMWSWKHYYATRRIELVDCAWEKASLRYPAPNLIALTEHYNKVSK
jgi:hypothetical protein